MAGIVPATAADVIALVPLAATVGAPSTGTILIGATIPAGTTINYQGLVLTAVAGPKTSGANDFNGSGAFTDIAADIKAAISDPANAWAGSVTATVTGTLVSLTTVLVGYQTFGGLTMTAPVVGVDLTGMAGGEVMLNTLVLQASLMVNVECWGEKTCLATLYLVLHFLSLIYPSTTGGASTATTIKIAEISKTYATATPTDALFGNTAWGKLYLALYDTVFCSGTTGGHLCIGVTG